MNDEIIKALRVTKEHLAQDAWVSDFSATFRESV
jgi:hypothetical protein